MFSILEKVIWEKTPTLSTLEETLLRNADRYNPLEKMRATEQLLVELENALEKLGVSYLTLKVETTTALLVGSATGLGALTTEVPLNWDPVLELPVIPGSALKGIARAWLHDYLIYGLNSDHENEEEAPPENDNKYKEAEAKVKEVFGWEKAVSKLTFYDAYPVEVAGPSLLSRDIVNPHYNPLTNPNLKTELDVQPNPVQHVAVAPRVTFHIVVAATPSINPTSIGLYILLKEKVDEAGQPSSGSEDYAALALLMAAAMAHSVGGRTLKGYGKLRVKEAKLYKGDST